MPGKKTDLKQQQQKILYNCFHELHVEFICWKLNSLSSVDTPHVAVLNDHVCLSSVCPVRVRGEEASSCPGDTGGSWTESIGK